MQLYAKYLRKSRFDHDFAELSVEETLKRHNEILDRLAEKQGYHIAKTYYEVVSGESIADRPEVQKLLSEVNEGRYEGVLVVDVERLARGNGSDQAYISQVFQFSGTKIITPMKIYDPRNEFDEEYFEFGLFMSRREYKTINRRLMRGRDSSAREGKYIGSIAPYGYARRKLEGEKGFTLAEDPAEGSIVRQIYALFLQGKGTKIIANLLNEQGIPTRHGAPWDYSTVAQILKNPVYTGKIKRGWKRQLQSIEDGRVVRRYKRSSDPADYALYDGMHPALVSADDFARAQHIRLDRQPGAPVRQDHALQNAFAGLIYCRACGKRITRATMAASQHGRVRLRCVGGHRCDNRSADYAVVEQEIIAALREWFQGYRVQIDTTGFAEEIGHCQKQLDRMADDIAGLEEQLERLYTLVEQGLYSPDLFRERHEKLQAAKAENEQQVSLLQETLHKLETANSAQSDLVPKTEALLASYDEMSVQERNDLLKAILRRIEYYKGKDGQIEIELYPRLPRL